MIHPLTQLPVSRRWQGQKFPIASVLALICRNIDSERVYLLINRAKPPYQGKWALVGGKWDFGEALAEAIVREVREETGLETTFVALRSCINERLLPDDEVDFGAHFVIFVSEVEAATGEAQEQAEGQVGWFSASQLEELHTRQEIVPTDYQIMQACVESFQAIPYVEAEVCARKGSQESSILRFERQE